MSAPTPARGGRRAASRRRPTAGPGAVAALAVLALAAGAVGLTRTPDPEPVADPTSAGLVDQALLVCPEGPEDVRGEVRAGLAPLARLGVQGSWRAGQPGDTQDRPVPARGEVVGLGGATVLEADGTAAAGAFAWRTGSAGTALAATNCVLPRARWWFVGAGATLDHDSVLTLTNADPGPAVVDVRVLSPDGEVETVGTRGITLGPGETRSLPLTEVAPQREELAVAVTASRGRVAAAVSDRVADGSAAPDGQEWLPATELPSRLVRLAGLPADARDRTLLVGNPADREALVDVEVSGPRGTFVPTGARTVSVPPGSVVSVDATDLVAGGDVAALRVRSQVPVVASLRSRSRTDHAYAGAAVPLTGPAVASLAPGSTGRLQLGAGAGGAAVSVTAWTAAGQQLDEQQVEIDPAATVDLAVARRAAYVLVEPLRGNVTGAMVLASLTGTAAVPLQQVPLRVALPVVVPGPR